MSRISDYTVRDGLRIEEIDGDLLVLDAEGGTIKSLQGDAADALRLVRGRQAVPLELTDHLAALVAAGVIERAGWSRRKALITGGVGLAAATTGLFAMELPAAAAASSCMNPGGLGDDLAQPLTFNSSGTFKPGRMVTMVTVDVWGGGGGGGAGNNTLAVVPVALGGGGAGGGGYSAATIDVTPCTVYTVTVGSGGGSGTDGGASSFGAVSASGGMAGVAATVLVNGTGGMGGAGTTTSGADGAAGMSGAGGMGGDGGDAGGTTMTGGMGTMTAGGITGTGAAPGGGGAGGYGSGSTGGSGAPGRVVITNAT